MGYFKYNGGNITLSLLHLARMSSFKLFLFSLFNHVWKVQPTFEIQSSKKSKQISISYQIKVVN